MDTQLQYTHGQDGEKATVILSTHNAESDLFHQKIRDTIQLYREGSNIAEALCFRTNLNVREEPYPAFIAMNGKHPDTMSKRMKETLKKVVEKSGFFHYTFTITPKNTIIVPQEDEFYTDERVGEIYRYLCNAVYLDNTAIYPSIVPATITVLEKTEAGVA